MRQKDSNYKGKNKRTAKRSGKQSVPKGNHAETPNAYNDPVWYFKYPELMKSAARIPFVTRPGMIVPDIFKARITPLNETGIQTDDFYRNIIQTPGIMCLDWVPSIGISNEVTSPASMTAKELYSNVRKEFSGTISADAPDFMIQILALDGIYSYIAYLKRIYRVVNTTNPNNYMLPEGVLISMGFTPQQIVELQVDRIKLLGVINTLIRMTDKFMCPKVFNVLDRHFWLNDRIYTDAPSANSQFYCFNPLGFYKFTLLHTPDQVLAGGLQYTPLQYPTTDIVDYMYNYGVGMIRALSEWESSYDINGYLMKAFADMPLFRVALLDENEQLEAFYSPEVLIQIQNSTSIPIDGATGTPKYTVDNTVTQDPKTNRLISNPTVTVNKGDNLNVVTFNEGGIINLPPDLVSEELIVEATRLKALYSYSSTDQSTVFTINCASEFIVSYRVTLPGTSAPALNFPVGGAFVIDTTEGNSGYSAALYAVRTMQFSWFDSHPLLPVATVGVGSEESGGETLVELVYYGQMANLGFMSVKDYNDMNRVCLFSEFNSFSIR